MDETAQDVEGGAGESGGDDGGVGGDKIGVGFRDGERFEGDIFGGFEGVNE